MHVVATAGHVDHGKSTLVRALTGMEPDRWAEERRRGMTIDLGFAWTDLPSGATVAFVDVPGHERFVPNMLAGVGHVPAVLFVVAADEGWMPQSAEHLSALDALDVRHALLAVTRTDLATDDAVHAVTATALAEIGKTSLGARDALAVEAVAVSATTGVGLDGLRGALDRLVARLPPPDLDAPVWLWVDRSFTIRGSGTVVTGTLPAGRLCVGDELVIGVSSRVVRVRGLHSLGRPVSNVDAVARVAVNLRGVDKDAVGRGDALLTPNAFAPTRMVDVRVHGDPVQDLPAGITLHLGSAAFPVGVRPLGHDTARLRLATPLPLRIGDRGLLRDPARHRVAGGVVVLDVDPPPLQRRGAAAARAQVLARMAGRSDEASELSRRLLVRHADLRRMGVTVSAQPVAGDWVVDPGHWADIKVRVPRVVTQWKDAHPHDPGPPIDAVGQALALPDRELVHAALDAEWEVRDGRVVPVGSDDGLSAKIAAAVETVRHELAANPFRAPSESRLAELGLGPPQVAAAVRAGVLLRVGNSVLLADAPGQAAEILGRLSEPFTVAEARTALDTTRRVAVPLLELLDRRGITRRLPDDRRRIVGGATQPTPDRDDGRPAPDPETFPVTATDDASASPSGPPAIRDHEGP